VVSCIFHAIPTHATRYIGGIVELGYVVVACYLLMTVRMKIRAGDQIPEGCCGGCDDCCVSYWCHCCAIAQMFSHLGVKGSYELGAHTGSNRVPANYGVNGPYGVVPGATNAV